MLCGVDDGDVKRVGEGAPRALIALALSASQKVDDIFLGKKFCLPLREAY
jgi:hypothetical protein